MRLPLRTDAATPGYGFPCFAGHTTSRHLAYRRNQISRRCRRRRHLRPPPTTRQLVQIRQPTLATPRLPQISKLLSLHLRSLQRRSLPLIHPIQRNNPPLRALILVDTPNVHQAATIRTRTPLYDSSMNTRRREPCPPPVSLPRSNMLGVHLRTQSIPLLRRHPFGLRKLRNHVLYRSRHPVAANSFTNTLQCRFQPRFDLVFVRNRILRIRNNCVPYERITLRSRPLQRHRISRSNRISRRPQRRHRRRTTTKHFLSLSQIHLHDAPAATPSGLRTQLLNSTPSATNKVVQRICLVQQPLQLGRQILPVDSAIVGNPASSRQPLIQLLKQLVDSQIRLNLKSPLRNRETALANRHLWRTLPRWELRNNLRNSRPLVTNRKQPHRSTAPNRPNHQIQTRRQPPPRLTQLGLLKPHPLIHFNQLVAGMQVHACRSKRFIRRLSHLHNVFHHPPRTPLPAVSLRNLKTRQVPSLASLLSDNTNLGPDIIPVRGRIAAPLTPPDLIPVPWRCSRTLAPKRIHPTQRIRNRFRPRPQVTHLLTLTALTINNFDIIIPYAALSGANNQTTNLLTIRLRTVHIQFLRNTTLPNQSSKLAQQMRTSKHLRCLSRRLRQRLIIRLHMLQRIQHPVPTRQHPRQLDISLRNNTPKHNKRRPRVQIPGRNRRTLLHRTLRTSTSSDNLASTRLNFHISHIARIVNRPIRPNTRLRIHHRFGTTACPLYAHTTIIKRRSNRRPTRGTRRPNTPRRPIRGPPIDLHNLRQPAPRGTRPTKRYLPRSRLRQRICLQPLTANSIPIRPIRSIQIFLNLTHPTRQLVKRQRIKQLIRHLLHSRTQIGNPLSPTPQLRRKRIQIQFRQIPSQHINNLLRSIHTLIMQRNRLRLLHSDSKMRPGLLQRFFQPRQNLVTNSGPALLGPHRLQSPQRPLQLDAAIPQRCSLLNQRLHKLGDILASTTNTRNKFPQLLMNLDEPTLQQVGFASNGSHLRLRRRRPISLSGSHAYSLHLLGVQPAFNGSKHPVERSFTLPVSDPQLC